VPLIPKILKQFQRNNELQSKIPDMVVEGVQQAALMGAISDAILAVDLEGSALFYNSRFAMLFDDKNLQNRKLWKMFLDQELLNAFQAALKDGLTNSVKAIPFDRPDGRQFFSVSVSPLRAESEEIYGAVGVFHDVTDLKRAEQIRIDFVANVSHELRTPLTAIKGYADTLVQDIQEGKPAQSEFLGIIIRNTDRLMALINDLLDLSSLESTDVLHKAVVNTKELTYRVIKQMEGPLKAKNHPVIVEASTESVIADPRRLEQVLVNLLDNANKYTPAGGKLFVSWEQADENSVVLKVHDTGPGINPSHHSRLFERFYRVDKSRSREMGGTGLGLAIVKHIMQRHGGSVWVESSSGKGSTFFCRFPN